MSVVQGLYFSSSDDSDSEDRARPMKTYKERTNFTRHVSDFQFNERFRMDTEELEFVLSKIGSHLKHKTSKNKALSPEQQVLMCLVVCRAVKKVVKAVVTEMTEEQAK